MYLYACIYNVMCKYNVMYYDCVGGAALPIYPFIHSSSKIEMILYLNSRWRWCVHVVLV